MKRFVLMVSICTLSLVSSCTTQPSPNVIVEGSWTGALDSNRIDITFIEGEFEGGPTLSGSAHLLDSTQTIEYLVMSGTTNRTDKIWFALYKVPVISKEDYHVTGNVSGGVIQGTFDQIDHNGHIIKSGAWQVQRIP